MIKLERLFQLQDEVLSDHLAVSELAKKMFDLLSDSLWLNSQVLTTLRFPPEKQTAIRRLACDTLSHAIVAIRTGLWGDLPESLTLLRGALESSVQLLFVVQEQKYKTAIYEMDRKFEQVSFESALEGLGPLGQRARKIHGEISEIAAHATASRMSLVGYEYNGAFYDRVGFARNPHYAELSLFYCMDVSLMVTQSLYHALVQDGNDIPWVEEMDSVNRRFEKIRKEAEQTWHASMKGVAGAGN